MLFQESISLFYDGKMIGVVSIEIEYQDHSMVMRALTVELEGLAD
jgi:hypothetical protein